MSNSGMTTIEVKRINRSKVYQMIYEKRSISKQELAQELHMGLTTVTQNLKALEEDGWIHRTGYYESTGGRKAQAIEIVSNARTAIGAFILRRSILLVALNLYGDVIAKKTVAEPFSATEAYFQFLGKEIMRFANHVESNPDRISGVGIAIQGILSPDRSKIQYGKLLQHTGLNTADLTRYIPYPCFTEHDSKAAAFAEIWNQSQLSDAVVFLLNKNLGSALVIHGEVHQGNPCIAERSSICVLFRTESPVTVVEKVAWKPIAPQKVCKIKFRAILLRRFFNQYENMIRAAMLSGKLISPRWQLLSEMSTRSWTVM